MHYECTIDTGKKPIHHETIANTLLCNMNTIPLQSQYTAFTTPSTIRTQNNPNTMTIRIQNEYMTNTMQKQYGCNTETIPIQDLYKTDTIRQQDKLQDECKTQTTRIDHPYDTDARNNASNTNTKALEDECDTHTIQV